MPRRVFLPWLIVGAGGIITFVSTRFFSKAAQPDIQKYPISKPRRKNRKAEPKIPTLEQGFYLNPFSEIIHYAPESPRPRFASLLPLKRLQQVDPTKLPIKYSDPKASTPRINISRASYAVEQAAANEINKKNIDRACELLLFGIRNELSASRIARFGRLRPYSKSPSLRLYDLLAGLYLRYNKPDQLAQLIDLIQKSQYPDAHAFDSRLKKWQDSQTKWYRRWTDRNKQVQWTVNKGLVLLM